MSLNQSRFLLFLLSAGALATAIFLRDPAVSLLLIGTMLIVSLIVLYRKMDQLAGLSPANSKTKTLKGLTLFSLFILLIAGGAAYLVANGQVSENTEKAFAAGIILLLMVVLGNLSTKIPFNRYTGLRLPWTVRDEETWLLAHRVLGYLSLPLSVIYLVLILTLPYFEAVTAIVFLLWIGVPSIISLRFFMKKLHCAK